MIEINIAIVDDSAVERNKVIQILVEYFSIHNQRYGITPVIFEFESGEEFLNAFHKDQYQLVLLDIYMYQLSGIAVAKKLMSLDKKCNIIFSTTSTDHMLDGYDVNAIGYILKPLTKDSAPLYKAVSRAMDRLKMDNRSIEFLTKSGEYPVFYRNIIYLEISLRNLYLHLQSDKILVLGKYSDYAEQLLADKRFLECYRNVIINMDFIDTLLEYDFILKTGGKVPISRRRKAEILEKYTAYLIERGSNE